MNIAMIKLFEHSFDYDYEKVYIVKNNKEKIEELQYMIEDARRLDNDDRIDKYGCESLIDLAESLVEETLEVIDYSRCEIDLY